MRKIAWHSSGLMAHVLCRKAGICNKAIQMRNLLPFTQTNRIISYNRVSMSVSAAQASADPLSAATASSGAFLQALDITSTICPVIFDLVFSHSACSHIESHTYSDDCADYATNNFAIPRYEQASTPDLAYWSYNVQDTKYTINC